MNKAFENLLLAVKKAKSGNISSFESEDNFWKAETDKAGNGFAIIRFLPALSEDDIPFVKTYNHGFQGPTGKWFIESCPTTIGQPCPVCEANSPLWNSGTQENKDLVRKRKRRTTYIANILVVSDPKNPDNEGKVFLFKFGPKIFDKIADKIEPPRDERGNLIDPDEEPMNPFDPISGANFKLKIRKVEGYSNFDKSEFEKPSELKNWDTIKTQLHDLSKFVNPQSFKSYDELKAKFESVYAESGSATSSSSVDVEKPQAKEKAPKVSVKEDTPPWEDDDDLEYFKRLAEE